MAKTITQLPDATVVNGSDELIIQQSGVTKRATKTEVLAGIVNANIDAAAAIAGTKISPDFGSQNVATSGTLTVAANGSANAIVSRASADTTGPFLQLRKLRGTGASPSIVSSGDACGTVLFYGHDGTQVIPAASVSASIDATPGVNDMPGRLVFGTTADGGSGTTERMRIDSSGNVGIGTGSPGAKCDLRNGTLRLSTDNSRTTVYGINRGDTGSTNGMCSIGMFGSGSNGFLGNIAFNTAASDVFDAALSERMRIDASGNVGIGTTSPNAAALLDVSSTTKGFLPPRMTTAQRDAISTPPAGLVIYNTSTNVLNFYNGSAWGAV